MKTAIATAIVVAVQIGCTYFLANRTRTPTIFVDHVQQLVYDGQVVRTDLGRAWIAEPQSREPGPTETRTVARVVLTKQATLELHKELSDLLSVATVR